MTWPQTLALVGVGVWVLLSVALSLGWSVAAWLARRKARR